MRDETLAVLEALEAKEAVARRRAMLIAWSLVLAAALILGGLIFLASRHLDTLRRQASAERDTVVALRTEKARLKTEIEALRPLAVNRVADAARESELTQSARDTVPIQEPLSSELPPDAPRIQPRVYLQIVRQQDRAYARGIGEQLEEAGFAVPGVEYVSRAAYLVNTEVRYYKKADEEDAVRLQRTLEGIGVESVLLYLGLENNTRVRPRHYEVWFGAGVGRQEPNAPAPPESDVGSG